jgi:hypothetical protein
VKGSLISFATECRRGSLFLPRRRLHWGERAKLAGASWEGMKLTRVRSNIFLKGESEMKRITPSLPRTPAPPEINVNEMDDFRPRHAEEEGGAPIKMAVCNGRTVDAPTGELRATGYDVEQKKHATAQICRRHYPGEIVSLPAGEARRLEALGYLIEPHEYKPLPTPKENEVQRIGPREQ